MLLLRQGIHGGSRLSPMRSRIERICINLDSPIKEDPSLINRPIWSMSTSRNGGGIFYERLNECPKFAMDRSIYTPVCMLMSEVTMDRFTIRLYPR